MRLWTALLLFGIGFGYVETAAAIYLRGLYEPMHQRVYPARSADDLFPLIPLERLEDEDARGMQWLDTELLREAATLVMLAAVGIGMARGFQQSFAVFLISFGLWDVFYYVFLKILIDWPDSLLTWDLLFLLPVPWAGPVLAPLLVACAMIGAGGLILRRASAERPLRLALSHWLGLVAGGAIVMAAFCWEYRALLSGGTPEFFPWSLYAAGMGVGLIAFGQAWWRSSAACGLALSRKRRTTSPRRVFRQ
jgi:hypothetical protein